MCKMKCNKQGLNRNCTTGFLNLFTVWYSKWTTLSQTRFASILRWKVTYPFLSIRQLLFNPAIIQRDQFFLMGSLLYFYTYILVKWEQICISNIQQYVWSQMHKILTRFSQLCIYYPSINILAPSWNAKSVQTDITHIHIKSFYSNEEKKI